MLGDDESMIAYRLRTGHGLKIPLLERVVIGWLETIGLGGDGG